MFSNYKFRASSLGRIMSGVPKPLTENQKATLIDLQKKRKEKGLTDKQIETLGGLLRRQNEKVKLSDGAKKYLTELVWYAKYNRSTDLTNKYLTKGIECEEKSFTLISEVANVLLLKNKERKTNEYFTGEADNVQGKIRDIKTSFDVSTFPIIYQTMDKGYEWQLRVYMDLYGFKEADLIYCLVDTPFSQVEDELKRLDWRFGIMDFNGNVLDEHKELVVETISNHIYTAKGIQRFCNQNATIPLDWFEGFKEIPGHDRVRIFSIEHSEEKIQQARDMVTLAREFMNKLNEQLT